MTQTAAPLTPHPPPSPLTQFPSPLDTSKLFLAKFCIVDYDLFAVAFILVSKSRQFVHAAYNIAYMLLPIVGWPGTDSLYLQR